MVQLIKEPSYLNTVVRYYELLEELTPAERAKRNAEKRRVANAKRDAAQRRKAAAARRYQDAMRTSNDTIQHAKNALASIQPS